MRTLRRGTSKLLLCMPTDLVLYLPILKGDLLQPHEGFHFVLHHEVEDDALQSLVEKLWISRLYSITIFRLVQVTRELPGHLHE